MTSYMNNVSNITSRVARVTTEPEIWSIEHLLCTSVALGLMILFILIGNAFVIAAIILEKNLHCVSNYLILSLAVADFMVAAVVMPISAVNEQLLLPENASLSSHAVLSLFSTIMMTAATCTRPCALDLTGVCSNTVSSHPLFLSVTKHWFLGSEVCDMWISMDVLCCTASILSLVAISVDRYWAVTKVDYTRKRTAKRILSMVALVWMVAFSISIPSIFVFKDDNDPVTSGICMISQDHVFTIFSTIAAFYLPFIVLLIIYTKIFIVARQRIRRKRFSRKRQSYDVKEKKVLSRRFTSTPEVTFLKLSHDEHLNSKFNIFRRSRLSDDHANSNFDNHLKKLEQIYLEHATLLSATDKEFVNAKRERDRLKRRRERKVALTLSIITGAFILCWLPFFIYAITAPFIRPSVRIPRLVESITLWLGYCNSLLNPIIYTVFNPEFRCAFKNLLYGKCLKKERRKSLNTLDSFWV